MLLRYDERLAAALKRRGVECFLAPGYSNISRDAWFEPPCGLKWLQTENHVAIDAFSYGVSGYVCEVEIGRYVSIGENVQIGRGDHPVHWVSTSPAFHLPASLFAVGTEFAGAEDYHRFRPRPWPGAEAGRLRRTRIGPDVWIGHAAFIRPGVEIGAGAVVGACSVVTRDVPPYAIVAGNPARILRLRFEAAAVAALLRLEWWRFAPWQLAPVNFADVQGAIAALEELLPRLAPFQPRRFSIAELAAAPPAEA
jgi:acetyltransferase-like isoleucine patch superfamily enzyme